MSERRPEEVVGVIPELTTWLWGGPPSECMEAIELFPLAKTHPKRIKRVVLLNAFVPPKRPMVIVTLPTNLENVKAIVRFAMEHKITIESYIGHEATALLLSQLLSINVPVNRAEYIPFTGDIAVVARLKRRLQSPTDIKDISPDDLEFHVVNYDNDWVLR
jgi:hypothetical protein